MYVPESRVDVVHADQSAATYYAQDKRRTGCKSKLFHVDPLITQSREWAKIKISGRASPSSLLLLGCASYPLRLPHRTKDLYTLMYEV